MAEAQLRVVVMRDGGSGGGGPLGRRPIMLMNFELSLVTQDACLTLATGSISGQSELRSTSVASRFEILQRKAAVLETLTSTLL